MKNITLSFFCFILLSCNMLNAQLKVLYKPILTSEMAIQIAQKSFMEAIRNGYQISVTVVDRSGQTLAVLRHHNAGIHTLRASYKKAFTATSQKRETAEIAQGIKNGTIPEDIRYLDENILILDGGIPIWLDGEVVGGIGVGGAHGIEDVRLAKVGILAIETNQINRLD
ncbi:GlcG/HbpS family heme-binding protein [Riemerella anatipestifer]|nr:heme-binding protein [Riemerella anatipestifer]MBO4233093.1 heme-binding protein [Riemerella anatipestifer]MCO4304032.1 heme-binding protein [Riemerella anatipestifer]MCO7352875.1 heme-binding protein [Riemerella anatipestifer]MCQ4039812.1 heme-binding protein [Riemerella anatipestifer]MCT6761074.1 heme-binding protein [Riemerella anatipestifer]